MAAYGDAQPPHQRVAAKLGELEPWLASSGVGEDWRPALLLDQLHQELAKGLAADRAAVMAVLGRFGADDPGLAMEPFVRVRQALVDWLASLEPPAASQLSVEARAAKSVFLPPTPVDLEDAKANLLRALDGLDAALRSPVPGERDWRALLEPDKIRQQMARKPGPELSELDAAYLRFTSGQEGLGRVVFVEVRNGLRQYLTLARAIGDPKLRKQYGVLLEALAVRLERYLKQPSAEIAEEIDQALDWLDQAEQARWLVRAVSDRLSHPNLFVEVSGRLIASRMAQPVDEIRPVRDCILKTDVHATGHTKGNLSVELVPSTDEGRLDLVFQGDMHLDSVGYRGPFQVFANTITRIGARKRLVVDHERIVAAPAESEADTSTNINCVASNRGSALTERIAARRAETQRPQAECIASRHAEARFNEQIDAQADKMVAEANERYAAKFRRPLVERRLFPELLRFSTSQRALDVSAMTIAEGSLAAPGAAPPARETGDLSVRVHQSAVNNLTGSALAGMIVDEKRVQQILTESLGAPKRPPDEEDQENWAITFPRRQPVSVTFGSDTFTVTIRGRAYASEGNQYPGMNVTATYKIDRSGKELKAVRQGDLVVAPPGYRLGSGRQLSAREQVLRKVLERRFGRFFGPEFVPKNIVLTPEGRPALELQLSHWATTNGWLLLAWKQVPLSKPEVPPTRLPPKPQSPT